MKLDLNRLHQKPGGRGSGNTIKMLATLMGNVEHHCGWRLHVVVVPNGRNTDYMTRAIIDMANAMAFDLANVGRGGREIKFANGCIVRIIHPERMRDLDGCIYRVFYDDVDPNTVDAYGARY